MKFHNDKVYLLLTLFSVLTLGLINLPTPLFGDQAFFLLGAKEMNEGIVLYRDFWDVKQPGIFYFYLIGGKIFGFTEIGIHLFELFYWLLFTIILVWFLKKYKPFVWTFLNYLVPIMIIGIYSISSIRSITQVEALVNFPLMLVIIFNTLYLKSERKNSLWLILSGIAGGLVLFFKIIFAPLLIAFWIYLLVKEFKINSLKSILFKALLIISGVILLWFPFLIYCFKHNILELCYNTFFKIPPLILKYGESKSIETLLLSARSFFSKLIFILPFFIYSLVLVRKRFLVIEMWVWMIIAIFIIVIQRNSWYSYHFQLLYTPIVFLGLLSIDSIFKKYEKKLNFKKPLLFTSLLIFINLGTIIYLIKKIQELSKYNFALTANDKLNYAITHKDNALANKISKLLNEEEKCPIFVVNDPLIYYYTNRTQATAQSGWSMQIYIPGQMQILGNELKKARPCYIFIRSSFDIFFETKGSEIMKWIRENYIVFNSNSDGIWYKFSL